MLLHLYYAVNGAAEFVFIPDPNFVPDFLADSGKLVYRLKRNFYTQLFCKQNKGFNIIQVFSCEYAVHQDWVFLFLKFSYFNSFF
ncbi:hypothetical protein SDC9_157441 [bioreactor metagenome]|uniref:Uncharacterized protein n=1 Tax=bioreactor metagenome TaxID=1076179 RepID=A0A645F949_9ZZZZ